MTTYLSRTEVAARIGVKVPTLARYNLPAPDAVIGTTGRGTKGWLPETIDAWDAARPGSGNWGGKPILGTPPLRRLGVCEVPQFSP